MSSATVRDFSFKTEASVSGRVRDRMAAETRADRIDLAKDMALAALMAATLFGVAAVVLLTSFSV
jgi:hypothetical protein